MTIDSLGHSSDPIAAVRHAYQSSLHLATTRGRDRSRAVQAMAVALERQQDEILEANTLDLEASREMAVPELILDWLKLTPERLQATVQSLQCLGELSDPIRRVMNATYQLNLAQTYCQLMPLGVIALIYEAFPELGAIAAGLCIKTGNSLILRGGSEASHSNSAIAAALHTALEEVGLPETTLVVLSPDQGTSIRELVTQGHHLNLVIPYGRPSLVQQVVRQATAPVLQTAMGNCYLYWAPSGRLEMVHWMIADSHKSQPDPVNAIEKVLVHRSHKASSALVELWKHLRADGFDLRGDTELVAEFPDAIALTEDTEWDRPYLRKTVAFRTINSLDYATSWINDYSSGHADCIATESYQESQQFALGVNSASTYINASPRFSRNPKRGGVFSLGMSNQKSHHSGLIGLETLTAIKHIVQGNADL